MAVGAPALLQFESTYARALPELVEPWRGAAVPEARLLVLNDALAAELGADAAALRAAPEVLAGAVAPEGAEPVAMAYAGHQFGSWVPRLGDGRALLLGEVVDRAGRRRDVHLKGSGRTPFARGGDGKAAVGPMLREHLVGEAMHALGIPTTRSLAVVATGEVVRREVPLPGAVLARVAASHLRVGTFQYAAAQHGPETVARLAAYAIDRHHPGAEGPLGLLEAVVEAQAALVARWMHVGFVHGVMNTDNVTISGETIDFGPCAFMDHYDPATVFSSIDHAGRYAFGNQPALMMWDLARLAEALLPLVDGGVEAVTAVLETFADRFGAHWLAGMRAKLGLREARPTDAGLVSAMLSAMHAERVDWTSAFRTLAAALREEATVPSWAAAWRERVAAEGADPAGVAVAMDAVNPAVIPRNHLVEDALARATAGDLAPFEALLDAVARPFEPTAGFTEPGEGAIVTYCGT